MRRNAGIVAAVLALAGVSCGEREIVVTSGVAAGSRRDAARCPHALPPGRHPEGAVAAAARREFPDRRIRGLHSLAPGGFGLQPVWRSTARERCDDDRVVARSWVVFTLGSLKEPSLTSGVHFFARTRQGWVDWFDLR